MCGVHDGVWRNKQEVGAGTDVWLAKESNKPRRLQMITYYVIVSPIKLIHSVYIRLKNHNTDKVFFAAKLWTILATLP